MPRPWTEKERKQKLAEIQRFYVAEERTIREVGKTLGISEKTVFQRLKRFGIPSNSKLKRRQDIRLPRGYTADLAEFFGVMLGDGKLSHFQIAVNLGTKEMFYAEYLVGLIYGIFNAKPKVAIRKNGYRDVYLGSVAVTDWLKGEGLVYNKVLSQVNAPRWIMNNEDFTRRFLRGFFDTDGSVYRLRWGMQVEFTNASAPLLKSVRNMLIYLGYAPSRVSGQRVYLTKKLDVSRFFRQIKPQNRKHRLRFENFIKNRAVT
ncbi:MAG: LAGLIDADG family homing endonuclease [bacterium]|nr:LAGLIDADG family homing endonuclease [bacterium]